MADTVTPQKRSEMMRGIRSQDTRPEMVVRKWLFANGYRYRLHATDVPGKPDLVFRQRRLAVFIHGCYWHRHESCNLAYTPKTNTTRWEAKFNANVARDERVHAELASKGWDFVIVWECEIRSSFETTMLHLEEEIIRHVRHA